MLRTLLAVICWLAPFWIGALFLSSLAFGEPYAISPSVSILRMMLLMALTLLGIIGSLITDETERLPRARWAQVLKTTSRSSSTLAALVTAPLVLLWVLAVTRSQPDLLFALITAFQNGWFWKGITRRILREGGTGVERTSD
jgi:hypothetical protein